jgi:PAS domain S-box-containing protein
VTAGALEPDYRSAFERAPVGLVLSRQRQMIDCNRELLAMFGATREQIVGQSFEILYPTPGEFVRTGQRIAARLMRKTGAATTPELVKRLLAGAN